MNEILISSLITLRENYVSRLQFFIRSYKVAGKVNFGKLKKLIPEKCIISPSDKGLGISLLQTEWYMKEYESQILKGVTGILRRKMCSNVA